MKQVAARTGLLDFVRFGHRVEGADWDDAAQVWRIATSKGDYTRARR